MMAGNNANYNRWGFQDTYMTPEVIEGRTHDY